jgi:hypothetical protein
VETAGITVLLIQLAELVAFPFLPILVMTSFIWAVAANKTIHKEEMEDNGGGIALVRAEEITSGACASISIAANGTGPFSTGTNDGNGGTGAAGSAVFWANTWSIDAGYPDCGNTSNPCNSLAGNPTGTDNDGIFNSIGKPLPIELLSF